MIKEVAMNNISAFSLKKLLIPAIIITCALFCTSCPKATPYVPPVPLMDLTMEADTASIINSAVSVDSGTFTLSKDQAKTGKQSLKNVSTFTAGQYKGSVTQVSLGSIPGLNGSGYDLRNAAISVSIYVPPVPVGHALPGYVVFVLFKGNDQLQSTGLPIPAFGGWITYTMNVWEYQGAGGSTNWWFNPTGDAPSILKAVNMIGIKTQKQDLTQTETFTYYIDDWVLFQY
jgi:hypothetical protein